MRLRFSRKYVFDSVRSETTNWYFAGDFTEEMPITNSLKVFFSFEIGGSYCVPGDQLTFTRRHSIDGHYNRLTINFDGSGNIQAGILAAHAATDYYAVEVDVPYFCYFKMERHTVPTTNYSFFSAIYDSDTLDVAHRIADSNYALHTCTPGAGGFYDRIQESLSDNAGFAITLSDPIYLIDDGGWDGHIPTSTDIRGVTLKRMT